MNIYPTKLIFFAWLGWLCTPTCLHAQSTSVLTLTQERYDVPLKSFYIDSVRDARKETTLVGHKNGKTPIVLQNSAATALKLFADSNITQDHGQTPVTVAISKLDIEARDEQGTWVTDGSVAFSFYAGGMPLVEFSDSGHQEAGQYAPDYIDLFIRQSFEGSLKQFDEWWRNRKAK